MLKIIGIFLIMGVSLGFAQTSRPIAFESKRIQDVFDGVRSQDKKSIDFIMTSGEALLQNITLPIYYQSNKEGKYSHIGFRFNSSLEDRQQHLLEIQFVERYILELVLWEDDTLITNRLLADKVQLNWMNELWGSPTFNKIQAIFPALNSGTTLKLVCDAEKCKAAIVNNSGNLLELSFRKNRQLITGKDKVEYGTELAAQLKSFTSTKSHKTVSILETELEKQEGNIWIKRDTSFYVIESLNQNMYLSKNHRGDFSLVHEKALECESLTNMLLYPEYLSCNPQMEVEHRVYGNDIVVKYSMQLHDFLTFFNADFKAYAGCENKADIFSYATLLLHNERFHFVNLLYVEADDRSLFTEKPKMKVKFYTAIPMDNINNLYGKMYE